MPFTVAIVGRPNVGKSTLFNRLVGRKLALVDDTPGVTRDRREGDARLGDLAFRIIDTAGYEDAGGDSLSARMQEQTELAIDTADVALLMIDARAGVTALDAVFADVLRRRTRPAILVANKCEGRAAAAGLMEAYELGLGEPVPISAEHGEGMADLFQALVRFAEATPTQAADRAEPAEDTAAAAEAPLQLAIVGRPNVGKSTLINRLLGDDRLVTGPEPGITRDAIAVEWRYQGRAVRLVDTAGLRRRAKIIQRLEHLAGADTLRAVRFAQAVVVVIDATQPLEKQDAVIAGLVIDEGRSLVIAANKWDLVRDRHATRDELRHQVETTLTGARGVQIVALSGLTGEGVVKLLPAVIAADQVWNARIPTPRLNDWLAEVQQRHPPPMAAGRAVKIRYATQAKTRPPTFALFVNRPDELPAAYVRYLTNSLRDSFDLPGTPIRIILRKPKNPYAVRRR